MSFYESKAWERKRKVILRRDGYLCQWSRRYGKHVEATTVHHILPLDSWPEYAFANWNLISLSAEAHEKMHYRSTRQLTAEGERLAERTALERGIEYPRPQNGEK